MKYLIASLIMLLMLSGCVQKYQRIHMDKIQIGMTKTEVEQSIGKPFNAIGSKQFPFGRVDVWEYRKYEWVYGTVDEQYWLYFLNDKLDRWGRPGDWSKEADQIYEFRIR